MRSRHVQRSLCALSLLVLACGARTGPGEPDGDFAGAGGGAGHDATEGGAGPPPPPGGCAVCDGHVQCGHCLVQAFELTYRCAVGMPAPAASCWDLDEIHVDQNGMAYTCFYCP